MPNKNLKLIQKGLNDAHAALVQQHTGSLPNFIIIGAAKSATTTLTTILLTIQIFYKNQKISCFLGATGKGRDWYASRFSEGQGSALWEKKHHETSQRKLSKTHQS